MGLTLLIVAAVVGVGAVLLYIVTSGPFPTPPTAVSDAAQEGEERIAAITGVDGVSIYTSADSKDRGPVNRPGAWSAHIDVTLEPQSTDVPGIVDQIEAVAADVRSTVATSGSIQIPADTGGAEASVLFAGAATSPDTESAIGLVMGLRRLPFAVRVSAGPVSTTSTVTVTTPAHLSETVTAAAALAQADPEYPAIVGVSVSGPEQRRHVSVLVGPDTPPPSAGLIDILARLTDDPRVLGVDFDAAREPASSERTDPWRPSLRIGVESPNDVQLIATSLAGAEVDSDTVSAPRAAFTVFASTDSDPYQAETEGYVGLPLGSAEPSDALPGVPLVDPVQEEAAVQKSRGQVESILLGAASTTSTGIAVNTSITDCDTEPGRQVTGSVLLPVADQIPGQEETFAEIVKSWEAQGFVRSDRALGTDIYSGDRVQLHIRGTSEGISISATSTCSGRP